MPRSVISIGFDTRTRFSSLVSDELSRSLGGGAWSGEISLLARSGEEHCNFP